VLGIARQAIQQRFAVDSERFMLTEITSPQVSICAFTDDENDEVHWNLYASSCTFSYLPREEINAVRFS
jgi:hypothetical protein